ncbi:hypothetical protein [Microcoleus sp. herbarium2]|uniref:hypothetical protein n=1 Tax=Microcoleus sp. herbarium2 TaxID=3055433 RepID=UPI002FD42739
MKGCDSLRDSFASRILGCGGDRFLALALLLIVIYTGITPAHYIYRPEKERSRFLSDKRDRPYNLKFNSSKNHPISY